jgi:hypothetical protein
LIAAHQTGRVAYVMELDPAYVDLTLRRYRILTGEEAVHEQTGLTFDAIQRARENEINPNKQINQR